MKRTICALVFMLAMVLILQPASVAKDAGLVAQMEDLPFSTGRAISGGAFTGTAYLKTMIPYDNVYHFPQTNLVTFAPGARSGWHAHGGMIVMAVAGVGYYQEEGKPAQILRKGDILEIPEGVQHWHGAAPDSWFSQIVIYDTNDTGNAVAHTMSGAVTDAYYAGLEAEEYTGRVAQDSAFTFRKADRAFTMSTFSGPAYVSTLVSGKNAAGSPELHYVVFDPGVINNWHTHAGGQILIATDGVGYHQIEGQEVEVLYPGDVAFCPPGVRHWHGGSLTDSFAHIAVNTNPEWPGVEWFDRLSDEEYEALQSLLPKTD